MGSPSGAAREPVYAAQHDRKYAVDPGTSATNRNAFDAIAAPTAGGNADGLTGAAGNTPRAKVDF